jgi:hypothetical protein
MVVGVKMEHRVASSEIGMTPVRSSGRFVPVHKCQLHVAENQRLGISEKKLTCGGKVGMEA